MPVSEGSTSRLGGGNESFRATDPGSSSTAWQDVMLTLVQPDHGQCARCSDAALYDQHQFDSSESSDGGEDCGGPNVALLVVPPATGSNGVTLTGTMTADADDAAARGEDAREIAAWYAEQRMLDVAPGAYASRQRASDTGRPICLPVVARCCHWLQCRL